MTQCTSTVVVSKFLLEYLFLYIHVSDIILNVAQAKSTRATKTYIDKNQKLTAETGNPSSEINGYTVKPVSSGPHIKRTPSDKWTNFLPPFIVFNEPAFSRHLY